MVKRLIFAAGAGGVVGAACGLAEAVLAFLPQPADETWLAELPAFALSMAIYAPIGMVVALVWAGLLGGVDGRSFSRRVPALTALGMAWLLVGVAVNRSFLPSVTHPLSIAFTLVWTVAFLWAIYRVWARPALSPAGAQV